MKKNTKLSFFITLIFLGAGMLNVNAQAKKKTLKDTQKVVGKTYLNDFKSQSGTYTADEIVGFISKPLMSENAKGKKFQVAQYLFTFKERGLFYDENGKPFVGVDVYDTYSEKGVVPLDWQKMLKRRMKSGDTVKFQFPLSFETGKSDKSFTTPDIQMIVK